MAQGRKDNRLRSVAVGFEDNTFAIINAMAKAEDRSFSAMVRVLVARQLAAEAKATRP